MMTKSPSKDAIFYIKYYATKHGCVIERKATIDDVCRQEFTAKGGYPCFNYVDVWATEKFGKTQYRTATHKWEFNDNQTLILQ
jgi:hypothetical protein